jgi:hypothetical protein
VQFCRIVVIVFVVVASLLCSGAVQWLNLLQHAISTVPIGINFADASSVVVMLTSAQCFGWGGFQTAHPCAAPGVAWPRPTVEEPTVGSDNHGGGDCVVAEGVEAH